jgi:hypothetical protein
MNPVLNPISMPARLDEKHLSAAHPWLGRTGRPIYPMGLNSINSLSEPVLKLGETISRPEGVNRLKRVKKRLFFVGKNHEYMEGFFELYYQLLIRFQISRPDFQVSQNPHFSPTISPLNVAKRVSFLKALVHCTERASPKGSDAGARGEGGTPKSNILFIIFRVKDTYYVLFYP